MRHSYLEASICKIFQVIALTEKLQSKAAAGSTGIKVDDHAGSNSDDPMSLNVQKKTEDRLSTGSGDSAVIDVEGANHLMDSSEESYFPEDYHCMDPADAQVHSEDDVSDEGCNYYSDGIFTVEHHHHQGEDSQLGWIWN